MKGILILAAVAAVLIFFASAFISAMVDAYGVAAVVAVCVLILAAVIAVLVLIRRRKKLNAEREKAEAQSRVIRINVPDVKAVPVTTASRVYDAVGLYRPPHACGPMPEVGEPLTFLEEPENTYDSEAIKAVYYDDNCDEQIAGYMNRTKLREMVRDWLKRGDSYACEVEATSPKLTVTITFYE